MNDGDFLCGPDDSTESRPVAFPGPAGAPLGVDVGDQEPSPLGVDVGDQEPILCPSGRDSLFPSVAGRGSFSDLRKKPAVFSRACWRLRLSFGPLSGEGRDFHGGVSDSRMM